MIRWILHGCMILALAGSVTGCGSGSKGPGAEDKLLKDQIVLYDEISAAYEKVTDKKSYAAGDAEIQSLMAKVAELETQLLALGAERKEAAVKTNKAQFDLATDRLKKAKQKASQWR